MANTWHDGQTRQDQCGWFFPTKRELRGPFATDILSVTADVANGSNLLRFCEERAIQVSWLLQLSCSLVLRAYSGESQVFFGYTKVDREARIGMDGMNDIATCCVELRNDVPLDELLLENMGGAIQQQQALNNSKNTSDGLSMEFNTVLLQHQSTRRSRHGDARAILGHNGAKVSSSKPNLIVSSSRSDKICPPLMRHGTAGCCPCGNRRRFSYHS